MFEVESTGLDLMDEDQRKRECVGSTSNRVGGTIYWRQTNQGLKA